MKKKRLLALFISIVMIVSLACGCADEDSKELSNSEEAMEEIEDSVEEEESSELSKVEDGVFTYPITSNPKVMNPLYSVDSDTGAVVGAVYDKLFVLDGEKDEIRYYLAEDLDISEDHLTYTLKLKEGLKWHDGEPLTADDIIFTMDVILDESQNTHFLNYFTISGEAVEVEKIDNLTVAFKLPEVSVPFITNLERLKPIPKHIFEGEEDIAKSPKNQEPVGSGPFKFKSFKSDERIELERFDDYHGGKAGLKEIVFRIIADPNSTNTAVLNGELDARRITANEVEKFEDKDEFNIEVFGGGRVNNMIFKLNNEALKNKDVRHAIAYAIDKDEIIQGVYQGSDYAEKTYSVFGPATKYQTNDVEKYEQDIEKAKELLKNAGYEDLSLRLAYTNTNSQQETAGLIMQQQLAEIGIDLELMPMERGEFVEKFTDASSTDFDLAFNGYNVGYEPNGYSPLYLSGEPNNFMGYVNEELDALWEEGIVETDEDVRKEIYEEIQKILVDEMVVYPIDNPKSILVYNKKLGGVEESGLFPHMFEDLTKLYKME